MGDFRQILATMRGDVHATMSVPALYIETVGSPGVPCTVRRHENIATHGGLQGTSFHYSEREEMDVKLRFSLAEIPAPKRGAIVSVSLTEAYSIDRRAEEDNGYVYCPALRLKSEDMVGLPVPVV